MSGDGAGTIVCSPSLPLLSRTISIRYHEVLLFSVIGFLRGKLSCILKKSIFGTLARENAPFNRTFILIMSEMLNFHPCTNSAGEADLDSPFALGVLQHIQRSSPSTHYFFAFLPWQLLLPVTTTITRNFTKPNHVCRQRFLR